MHYRLDNGERMAALRGPRAIGQSYFLACNGRAGRGVATRVVRVEAMDAPCRLG